MIDKWDLLYYYDLNDDDEDMTGFLKKARQKG